MNTKKLLLDSLTAIGGVAIGIWIATNLVSSCSTLSEPLPADPSTGKVPQVEDGELNVEIPVGLNGDGTAGGSVTISVPPSGAGGMRDATKGDAFIDAAAGVGGTLSGNPLLWGSLAQLARLGLGLSSRKKVKS